MIHFYKILLIVQFSICCFGLKAQGYLPIFKDVNRWCTRGISFSYWSFPYDFNYLYSQYNDNTDSTVFVKDTIISSKVYKALRNPSFGSFFYKNVISFVREDTISGKAWYLDSQLTERLLYDFTLTKGDSLRLNFLFPGIENEYYSPVSGYYFIDSTFTLNVYGASRRILFLKLKAYTNHLYKTLIWIEGIGSNTLPVYLNTPALNETVYNSTDNYFLHNYSDYKRATELVVIEKSTSTLFVKPMWDCNKRRNITTGVGDYFAKSNINIRDNIIHVLNEPLDHIRVIIQNTEGKILFDKEYFDPEISIDEMKIFPQGILIIKVIKQNKVYIFKHFNY